MELSARAITVERGGREILSKITADLLPGQLTAICGPNGAGKSTLLGALSGLHTPPLGGVFLGDHLLEFLPAATRAKMLGLLVQNGEIAWDLSVANLVALGRLPHGDEASRDGQQAIALALQVCDLTVLASRPVSTLSGGERARALMARVLAGRPAWVLADEPFSALDLAHQFSLLQTFRGAVAEGCGVVLVVHDLALAMNYADRVIVLDRGQMVADGPPQEALTPEVIAQVWQVDAQWLGEPGHYALVVR